MSTSSRQTVHVETEFDKFYFEGYTSELSVNAFIPTRINPMKQTNSYDSQQRKSSSVYDKIFQIKSDFNPKAHRDDRQHSKFIGLNQATEEKEKAYPSRSSSEYGRRNHQVIPFNHRSYVKIDHVKNDFYRNNGIIQ